MPTAGAAEGPAAEEHGAFVLHAVGLGRNVGARPPREAIVLRRTGIEMPGFPICCPEDRLISDA